MRLGAAQQRWGIGTRKRPLLNIARQFGHPEEFGASFRYSSDLLQKIVAHGGQ